MHGDPYKCVIRKNEEEGKECKDGKGVFTEVCEGVSDAEEG